MCRLLSTEFKGKLGKWKMNHKELIGRSAKRLAPALGSEESDVSVINHFATPPFLLAAWCSWHLNCCFLSDNCISILKKKKKNISVFRVTFVY